MNVECLEKLLKLSARQRALFARENDVTQSGDHPPAPLLSKEGGLGSAKVWLLNQRIAGQTLVNTIIFAIAVFTLSQQSDAQSWISTGGPVRVALSHLAIDGQNDSIVYAVGNGLFKSTDAGNHWTLLSGTPTQSVAVNPLNSNSLIADNLKSTDGGATFSLAPIPAA